ncbi:MAG: sel1 repeat family protein [Proteobacteria bacterium]|nr:sel1 repeat family protein [Pseudomonadota bacterium]
MRIFFHFIILVFTFFFIDFEFASAELKTSDRLFAPQKVEFERPLFYLEQIALQQKTMAGDQQAEFETALRYYYGFSRRLDVPFKQNYENALKWFEKAYRQEHVDSTYFLGIMYLKAQGTEQNYNRAIGYFKLAGNKGLVQATHMLALLSYELYEKTELSDFYHSDYLTDAKALFKTLANKQDPRAAFNLAIIKLATEVETRFLLAEINDLLLIAIKGFAKSLDKQSSMQVMELVTQKDLKDKEKMRKIYNNTFVGIGLKKLKSYYDF